MNRVFISLFAVIAIGASVMVYQATHSTKSLVLLPSEVLAKAPGGNLERVRVGGKVTAEPIGYSLEPEIVLTFTVEDPTNAKGSLPVIYKGLKPDMFATGRSVMIDGDVVGGTLMATKLLTQCPSKYEPPLPKEHTPA